MGLIASEVVQRGRSFGWMQADADLDLAAAVEARLAKFNIGYVDEVSGAWAYVARGTVALRELLRTPPSKRGGPRKNR